MLLFKMGIIPTHRDYFLYRPESLKYILYGMEFGNIEKAIKEDDLESFIMFSSEPMFDHNILFTTKEFSVFEIHVSDICYTYNYDPFDISCMQLMVFFGSVKCFKHAILTGEFSLKNIQKFAIAGGNSEIIHIMENQGVSFDFCFGVSAKYHRNELSDWLILHYRCEEIDISNCIYWFNYNVLFYLLNNSFCPIGALLPELYDHFQYDKFEYIMETYNTDVNAIDRYGYSILHRACRCGNLDFVKFLVEECNADISLCAYVDDELIDEGGSALHQACLSGNLELVKYLIETCKADIYQDDNRDNSYPICYAYSSGNTEILKYLVFSCGCSIGDLENYDAGDIKSNELMIDLFILTSQYGNKQCFKEWSS